MLNFTVFVSKYIIQAHKCSVYFNRVSPLMSPHNFSFEIALKESSKVMVYKRPHKTFCLCHVIKGSNT